MFVVPLRVLRLVGFVLAVWFAMRAFGVLVPPAYLLASMPVVLLVGTIPITPAGSSSSQRTAISNES